MRSALNRRSMIVWVILTSITLGYVWIDQSADDSGRTVASTAVTVSTIVLALLKVRIIMREFMEVRRAPTLLCRLTDLWVLVMGAALLGAYLAGKAYA